MALTSHIYLATSPPSNVYSTLLYVRLFLLQINLVHLLNVFFEKKSATWLPFDMYKYADGSDGFYGKWKPADNEIIERRPDGSRFVRFDPVPAFQTADYMEQLHSRFNGLQNSGKIEPLILIPAYILDFLCIHPFGDGNGRIARLVALLLLYKAGYEVGRYISLEMQVERTRESYYDTLYKSSQDWHEGNHNILPWWEYFLGVMLLPAYREFEERTGLIMSGRGAKREMVIDIINHLPKNFQYSDIEQACPGVSRPTINRILKELRLKNQIICIKTGREATWEKT
jgi:Fic family protein